MLNAMSTAFEHPSPPILAVAPPVSWLTAIAGMALGVCGWLLALAVWQCTNGDPRLAGYGLAMVPSPWVVAAGVVWFAARRRVAPLLTGGIFAAAVSPLLAWLLYVLGVVALREFHGTYGTLLR